MCDKITVIVCDDHYHERKGFVDTLKIIDDIEIIGEAKSPNEAVLKVRENKPDVLLYDLFYPGFTEDVTMNAIEEVRKISAETRILAVTNYFNIRPELVERARQAGAHLVVSKDVVHDPDSLGERIREVLEIRWDRPTPLPIERLTERELEVLRWVAKGYPDKAIARELNIAEGTVKKHLTDIFDKLGVRNRAQATAMAYELGLLPRGTVGGNM
ncbi:MAG: response regulator transcription factor [Anaerolineae bacterium]|nr:response regulator transcription factor [Caldilineales bacterium]MDW8269077.1 response regulator transcription factor [Anaerolineae bacterium]